MPEQKMKITDEQFQDFTGTMFNTPFTHSVSDVAMTEYRQNRLTACFKSEPHAEDVSNARNAQTAEPEQEAKADAEPVVTEDAVSDSE